MSASRDGDVVVTDKLGSHKAGAIRAAGTKLIFLLPYSPDLNPIEQVFAKLTILLRNANARSVEAVIRGIGKILDEFTARERENDVESADYRSTHIN